MVNYCVQKGPFQPLDGTETSLLDSERLSAQTKGIRGMGGVISAFITRQQRPAQSAAQTAYP